MKKDHLVYKEFIGSVHYNTEDEILYGTIQGIPDLVSYEGDSVAALKKGFVEAVNSYIDLCKKLKKPTHKSLKGSFNVRIKPELHQKAFTYAVTHGITLNQLVQNAMEKELAVL
jgi:predicted HicB family RNase H-like nuclease